MKKIIFLTTLLTLFLTNCSKTNDSCYNCDEPISTNNNTKIINNRTTSLDQLQYNQVLFKGSHNSYDRWEDITEQITEITPAYQNNVLALELDIWRNTSKNSYTNTTIPENTWIVNHWPHPGRYGKTLASYFYKLKDWHNKNRNHLPIMIKLDVKSAMGGYQNFHEQIDWYVQQYLGDDIIFKAQRMFKNPNMPIRDNVLYENAWPSLQNLRGKFIIVLTGNDDWMDQYVRTNSRYRLAFGMKAQKISSSNTINNGISDANKVVNDNPNYVFYNFSIVDINKKKNKTGARAFAHQLAKRGMITRVYSANNKEDWERCKDWKISCISTNMIKNHEWAQIAPHNRFIKR